MLILAIETATDACSVALADGATVLERFAVAPREHTQRVLPWVDELLAEGGRRLADVDAIAVTRGPGSFTGVRIGISVAQGLAAGAGVGLVGVSTLEVMAHQVRDATGARRVVVALDARMEEIYVGAWTFDGAPTPAVSERVAAPDELELPGTGWVAAGPGFERYARLSDRLGDRLDRVLDEPVHPRAGSVARLARAALAEGVAPAPEALEPAYLRDRVARKPGT